MSQKIIIAVGELSTDVHIWKFPESIPQVIPFTGMCFKWSVKKHCVVKIILGPWEIFFHENNCNNNSYK